MAVSSVCSRWRELALSSPSLWANLRMEIYPTAFEETLAGLIDTLKRYLERSGDWPLRLDLNIQGQGRELPSLIHLAQNAYRWRTFIFSGVHSFTTYEILSQMRFPVLEELDLNSTSEWVQCLTSNASNIPQGSVHLQLTRFLHSRPRTIN
ncbi:hypothetical protein BDP27DRAFT_1432546 [Rhodocollybia butyracea]|uniref:F-box domain-containing protein n=1 Tax=Rhodocollybia butyracea TaxID=206335 RepID=A0A9P5P819_9AGAR|nr:hypothetical protein BDP27DRAFT_1432546 [Rhodocollybia butyracea]